MLLMWLVGSWWAVLVVPAALLPEPTSSATAEPAVTGWRNVLTDIACQAPDVPMA